MSGIPNCLCNEADMTACDWTVDVVVTVQRADPGSTFKSVSTTKQESLSQIEASNMGLHIVQGAVAGVADALISQVKACSEADQDPNPVAMARTMFDFGV